MGNCRGVVKLVKLLFEAKGMRESCIVCSLLECRASRKEHMVEASVRRIQRTEKKFNTKKDDNRRIDDGRNEAQSINGRSREERTNKSTDSLVTLPDLGCLDAVLNLHLFWDQHLSSQTQQQHKILPPYFYRSFVFRSAVSFYVQC